MLSGFLSHFSFQNAALSRAVYVAIGIKMDGCKEVLGLWTSANDWAKFWLQVLTKLRNRGMQDVFIM